MEYLLDVTPAEAVANGAQLLDEKLPGWHRQITLEQLALESCRDCVCGQLGETALGIVNGAVTRYEQVIEMLGLGWHSGGAPDPAGQDWEFGFNTKPYDEELEGALGFDEYDVLVNETYAALEKEWRLAIEARLEMDRQPVPVETNEKETVTC